MRCLQHGLQCGKWINKKQLCSNFWLVARPANLIHKDQKVIALIQDKLAGCYYVQMQNLLLHISPLVSYSCKTRSSFFNKTVTASEQHSKFSESRQHKPQFTLQPDILRQPLGRHFPPNDTVKLTHARVQKRSLILLLWHTIKAERYWGKAIHRSPLWAGWNEVIMQNREDKERLFALN